MAKNTGLGSSAAKLKALGFDPLEAQVRMYNMLLEEIANQEKIAAGTLERLNKDGSAKAYRIDFHMGLVEKASILAEKLARYGYARVSETAVVETTPPVLNINLSDQGGTFTLNPPQEKPDADNEG